MQHSISEIKKLYNNGKGNLIPFIGSGFSANIEKYPTWDEFIEILASDIKTDLRKIFKNNLLEATEFYIWEKGAEIENNGKGKTKANKNNKEFVEGKVDLLDKLKKLFNAVHYNKNKWAIHDTLVHLFNKVIYTTNWDDTLEKANGNSLNAIYETQHFKTCKDKPSIIKFHGHYDVYYADSLIACETDYLNRMSKENSFDIRFKNDLLSNDFIFIGYSFRDPNIKLLIHQIHELLEDVKHKHKPKLYWLTLDYHNDERVKLVKYLFDGIIIPVFLLTDQQEKILKDIDNKIKKRCHPCTYYWECDNEKCKNYAFRESKSKEYSEFKKEYGRNQTKVFLNMLK